MSRQLQLPLGGAALPSAARSALAVRSSPSLRQGGCIGSPARRTSLPGYRMRTLVAGSAGKWASTSTVHLSDRLSVWGVGVLTLRMTTHCVDLLVVNFTAKSVLSTAAALSFTCAADRDPLATLNATISGPLPPFPRRLGPASAKLLSGTQRNGASVGGGRHASPRRWRRRLPRRPLRGRGARPRLPH